MMWRNNPFILGILFFATCILQPVLQFNPSAAQDTVIIGNAPDQSVEINFETLDQITNTVTIPDLFLRSGRLKYNQSLVKSQNEGKNTYGKNDEKKNNSIKGDFKITRLIVFIVRMASEALVFFKDCITKNENAKYTPPINPKLIIAISSSHKSKDIISKSIFKSTHHTTNKKPHERVALN